MRGLLTLLIVVTGLTGCRLETSPVAPPSTPDSGPEEGCFDDDAGPVADAGLLDVGAEDAGRPSTFFFELQGPEVV